MTELFPINMKTNLDIHRSQRFQIPTIDFKQIPWKVGTSSGLPKKYKKLIYSCLTVTNSKLCFGKDLIDPSAGVI